MSEGPIKRERLASTVETLPPMPRQGDTVSLNPPPLGYSLWRISHAPSAALGPSDIVTLIPVDDRCPVRTIRRRVAQIRLVEQ